MSSSDNKNDKSGVSRSLPPNASPAGPGKNGSSPGPASLSPGPEGIKGPEGPEGPEGSEAIKGVEGIEGIEGVKGHEGIKDVEGPAGVKGPEGTAGNNDLDIPFLYMKSDGTIVHLSNMCAMFTRVPGGAKVVKVIEAASNPLSIK